MNDYTYFRNYPAVAYGKIYVTGYGGVLYSYDITNGKLLWTYGNGGPGNSTFAGLETSYGTYPYDLDVIADGKLFLGSTEHSPNSPFYKDVRYRVINATDGTEIWTLMGWGTGMDATYDRVADGYFVFLNTYDMQVYTVGKGPSQMTVSIADDVIPYGSSVMIKGTITDIAAGTKQKEQAARFPNGVPAVSDASQTEWMEYVYMQKPRPTNAVGVPIVVSAVDSNGNYRELGTVTSTDGFFSLNWKPDIEGKYTVYASFAGSESYWPSHAITAFAVDPAAPTASPYPKVTIPNNDMYIIGMGVAIIIVIAIVGAVLLMAIKKRP
jgi:hypothetical protein